MRRVLSTIAWLSVCGDAADGVEGIEQAKELRPDLILLDLAMPNLNGAVAASILKRELPNVPIILFTMYAGTVEALAPKVGVDMVLSKPDGIYQLANRVERMFPNH